MNVRTVSNLKYLIIKIQKATNEKVFKLIKSINYRKIPDFDGIWVADLINIINETLPVITHFINVCIHSQYYPQRLKMGTTGPIYKKVSCTDINNYKPITILTCMDKIIETYFCNYVNKYLQSKNISQYAIRVSKGPQHY